MRIFAKGLNIFCLVIGCISVVWTQPINHNKYQDEFKNLKRKLQITITDDAVFSGRNKILLADPATFQRMNNTMYAKDENYVYHHFFANTSDIIGLVSFSNSPSYNELRKRSWLLENTGESFWEILYLADPKTFVIHPNDSSVAYDKDYLYIKGVLAAKTDGRSWQKLNDLYSKTDDSVFYSGILLPQMDSKSFQIFDLNKEVVKDDNGVYLNHQKFHVVKDPKSFELISQNTAKDKFHSYTIESFSRDKISINKSSEIDLESLVLVDDYYDITRDENRLYIKGKAVKFDVDVKSFHMIGKSKYAKDDQNAYYVDWRNIVALNVPSEKFQVDSDNPKWAQTDQYIFYDGKLLDGLDVQTFERISESYVKDDKQVMLVYGAHILPMQVDVDSFVIIKDEMKLSKDHQYVYVEDQILEQADPNTFELMNENGSFAKDHKNIFWKDGVYSYILLQDVDLATFKLSSEYSAEDKNYSYSFGKRHAKQKPTIASQSKSSKETPKKRAAQNIKNCNCLRPIQHKCMSDAWAYHGHLKENGPLCSQRYQRDNNYLYQNKKIIEGADPNSFVFINYLYFKDKDHVFYDNQLINSSDPNTFEVLSYDIAYPSSIDNDPYSINNALRMRELDQSENSYSQLTGYGKDDRNVFYHTTQLTNADVKSFKAMNNFFGKDGQQVFYKAFVIPDADPTTFQPLDGYYARDHNALYFQQYKIADLAIVDDMEGYIEGQTRHYFGNTLGKRIYPDGLEIYHGRPYARVGTKIFYENRWIENAEANTFSLVIQMSRYKENNPMYSKIYARDKAHIYFKHEIMNNVDPNSFIEIEVSNYRQEDFAKAMDRQRCYLNNLVISCNELGK